MSQAAFQPVGKVRVASPRVAVARDLTRPETIKAIWDSARRDVEADRARRLRQRLARRLATR